MSKKMSMPYAREAMYQGLERRGKRRMEFLSVSIAPDLKIYINEKFDLLMDRFGRCVNKWGKRMEVSYCRVTVYREETSHIHALVIKPWISKNDLIRMWEEITGVEGEGSLRCRTVLGDKENRNDMKKLVNYMLKQGDEHVDAQVEFVHSNNWKMWEKEVTEQKGLEI